MTRDYAHTQAKAGLSLVKILTAVAVAAGVGLLASVFFTPMPENEERLIRDTETTSAAPAAKPVSVAKTELPPEEPARFKFYELLPNLEVIPFTDPTPVPTQRPQSTTRSTSITPAPKVPVQGEQYWVQAGSFRAAEDAESRRVALILLGFAPRVEVADIPGKGRFHRVKIGPQADTKAVRKVMQQLAEAGIDSYFTRQSTN